MASRHATIDEVRALSPALSSSYPGNVYPDALLTTWLEITRGMVGVSAWRDMASHGHALLTAHFAARAVSGAFGPAGAMTSSSPDSKSWAGPSSPGSTDDDLRTTSYGTQYLTLRAVVLARVGTAFVGNSTLSGQIG